MSERDAIAPQVTPRRRRSGALTLPSGLLVFVCMVLPTLRVCGHPPDELPGMLLPPLWPLYTLGLLIAITAVRWRRSRMWGWAVLGMIWTVCVMGLVLMLLAAFSGDTAAHHIAVGGGILACVAAPSLAHYRETRVASAGAAAALGLAIAFGAFGFVPDFVWGVFVACGASAVLAAGCV